MKVTRKKSSGKKSKKLMNTQQTPTNNNGDKDLHEITEMTEAIARADSEFPAASSSNRSTQPPLDAETLEQLRLILGQDTPQMLAGLIEIYLENTPQLLEDLRQAIESKDQWQQVVDTLKANSIAFGAVKLCALCEELAANETAEGTIAKLAEIEAEYERVEAALKAEWHRLYQLRLKTDIFFPTGSYKNIGFYPKSTHGSSPTHHARPK
jgi:HPt (histidine-containing phosphotransfer) domain-containing protein